jgi:hypothetical protein
MRNEVTPKAMRRWRRFWQREVVDRPLLGAAFEMPIPTEAFPSGEPGGLQGCLRSGLGGGQALAWGRDMGCSPLSGATLDGSDLRL